MSAAMKSMNLEKISTLMDKFEKEFEDLDVQTSVMEGAMSQTTATSIPQDAVENLMKQVSCNVYISVYLSISPVVSSIFSPDVRYVLFSKFVRNCLMISNF